MAFVMCYGYCAHCRRLFAFNPVTVPSVRIDGYREPVCEPCVIAANPERVRRGLQPITYAEDAYQPCDEDRLEW